MHKNSFSSDNISQIYLCMKDQNYSHGHHQTYLYIIISFIEGYY